MYNTLKIRAHKFHYTFSEIFMAFALLQNIEYVFSFLDDRSDSSFVPSLTHIPKEQESRHLHLSSSDMTLQDPWHDLFYFQKAISGKEITIDLEMVKNNT